MIGNVARLKDEGYGFIKPLVGDRDIFFLSRELNFDFAELNEGDVVEFVIEQTARGPNATNVSRASFEDASLDLVEKLELPQLHHDVQQLSVILQCFDDQLVDIQNRKASEILNGLGIPEIRYAEVKRDFAKFIVAKLKRNPAELRHVHPDIFELLCAELLESDGFDVERLGRWNEGDGGIDIMAIKKVSGITVNFAVQVKHTERKVSAAPIRELNGVLDRFKAHQGLLITSSTFTPNAVEEVRDAYFRVSLEDKNSVLTRLSTYLA